MFLCFAGRLEKVVPPSTTANRRKKRSSTTLWIAFGVLSYFAQAFQPHVRQSKRPALFFAAKSSRVFETPTTDLDHNSETGHSRRPHFIFPGGGIFFYWQAGVISFLREQGYDTKAITSTGASAGALTATLTATGVDFYQATELALDLAAEARVWDRPEGLQGIWGDMIHDWLDELLPHNAVELANESLSLLVTPLPNIFGPKDCISIFESRADLIECNMASIHLPWFLDGKLTAKFRNQPHIDGSFLTTLKDYENCPTMADRTVSIAYWRDPAYQSKWLGDIAKTISPDGIYDMLEDGKTFAKQMEEEGEFEMLSRLP